jgi:superfamily I DNA/RNA helicase
MPRHIQLAPRAMSDLPKLPSKVQGAAVKQIWQLSKDHTHPSLGYRAIRGCKDARFEARINQKYRMVVVPRGECFIIVLIDDHEEAYRRAPGALIPEVVAERVSVDYDPTSGSDEDAGEAQSLFSAEFATALLRMGISEEALPEVLECVSTEQLFGIGLPDDLALELCYIAEQGPAGPALSFRPESADDVARAVEHPRPFETRLPRQHQSIVDRRLTGPLLVRGSAGSGKTLAAFHRALRLAREGQLFAESDRARVLFLCYSRLLARTIENAFDQHLGEERGRVEVCTVDEWCDDYLRKQRNGAVVLKPEDARGLIRDAVRRWARQHPTTPLGVLADVDFVYEEIQQVIEGRMALDEEAYLGMRRVGRVVPIEQSQRRIVWAVFTEYRRLLSTYGGVDYDGLALEALEALANDADAPLYDTVIVDEAQDFAPSKLRIAKRLAEQSRVIFFADAAQRLYQPGFEWRDLDIDMSGRTEVLVRDLRQTFAIHRFVDAVGGSIVEGDDADAAQAMAEVRHDATPRKGPKATVVRCFTHEHELEFVVADILRQIESGTRKPGEIAVLALRNRLVNALTRRILAAGIPVIGASDLMKDPSSTASAVKVLTCHSAKGLDFPVVYLCDVNDGSFPFDLDDGSAPTQAHVDRSRRALYVACSRACNELWLTYTADRISPFLESVPRDVYRAQVYPVSPSSAGC